MILCAAIIAFMGWIIEKILFEKILGEMYASFMVSLGLNLSLPAIALVLFGERMKSIQTVFPGVIKIFGAHIALERIFIILSCGFVTLILTLFINKTKTGRALRAIAQDSEAASLMGINCVRTSGLAFAIAAALSGIAAIIVLPAFYVDPFVGGPAIFKAMVVVIIGGLGSIPGAMLGGLLLGFIEGISMTFIGSAADMIGWIAIIFLILFRPLGLMGKEQWD
jgi:branched-chain amino acid transport system permease protein